MSEAAEERARIALDAKDHWRDRALAAEALLKSLIETDDAGRVWLAEDPGPTAGRIYDHLRRRGQ